VSPDPLVHIGFHKTGTTWLQRGLFASAPFRQPFRSSEIRDAIVRPTFFDFDEHRARAALHTSGGDLVEVLSDERLSGSPHAGGHDSAQIAQRLAATFPAARVLIVFREQRAAIYAVFQQYVRDGGAAPLHKYLRPRGTYEIPQFRLEHFEYDRLIALYRDLFSPDNVLALPYEELARDPLAFVQLICALVDVMAPPVDASPTYESWSALAIAVKRQLNRVVVRNALNPAGPIHLPDHEARAKAIDTRLLRRLSTGREARLRADVDGFVQNHFDRSNQRLSSMLGMDLRAFGYSVA
jgi:hypothetical protein